VLFTILTLLGLTFIYIIFQNSLCAAKKTHRASINNTDRLMLLMELTRLEHDISHILYFSILLQKNKYSVILAYHSAMRSNTRNTFVSTKTVIVSSNPTRSMGIWMFFVLSCIGDGLATG
jgi:hypothetical protein